MKINTSELTGAALDWAVAQCEGHLIAKHRRGGDIRIHTPYPKPMFSRTIPFCPSTDWVQGGTIIEREKISVEPCWDDVSIWVASMFEPDCKFNRIGNTPLIAAMRCYVAGKMGDEIEIPEELK
jgi:hypothetical protein